MAKSVDGQLLGLFAYIRIHIVDSKGHSWNTSLHINIRSTDDILTCYNELLKMMQEFEEQFKFSRVFVDEQENFYWDEWFDYKKNIKNEIQNINQSNDAKLEKLIEQLYKINNDIEGTAYFFVHENESRKKLDEKKNNNTTVNVPDCCNKLFKELKRDLLSAISLKMFFSIDSELNIMFTKWEIPLTWAVVHNIALNYTLDKITDKLIMDWFKEKLLVSLKESMIAQINLHITQHELDSYPRNPEDREMLAKFWNKFRKMIEAFPAK